MRKGRGAAASAPRCPPGAVAGGGERGLRGREQGRGQQTTVATGARARPGRGQRLCVATVLPERCSASLGRVGRRPRHGGRSLATSRPTRTRPLIRAAAPHAPTSAPRTTPALRPLSALPLLRPGKRTELLHLTAMAMTTTATQQERMRLARCLALQLLQLANSSPAVIALTYSSSFSSSPVPLSFSALLLLSSFAAVPPAPSVSSSSVFPWRTAQHKPRLTTWNSQRPSTLPLSFSSQSLPPAPFPITTESPSPYLTFPHRLSASRPSRVGRCPRQPRSCSTHHRRCHSPSDDTSSTLSAFPVPPPPPPPLLFSAPRPLRLRLRLSSRLLWPRCAVHIHRGCVQPLFPSVC